jgi:hypothetical protein
MNPYVKQRIEKHRNFVRDVVWMSHSKHTGICLDPTHRKRSKELRVDSFFLHFSSETDSKGKFPMVFLRSNPTNQRGEQ